MSMIENLTNINKRGILEFVMQENQKWRCRQCNEILTVHTPACSSCGQVWNQSSVKNEVLNQVNTDDPKQVS
jgi:rubrerythrin